MWVFSKLPKRLNVRLSGSSPKPKVNPRSFLLNVAVNPLRIELQRILRIYLQPEMTLNKKMLPSSQAKIESDVSAARRSPLRITNYDYAFEEGI